VEKSEQKLKKTDRDITSKGKRRKILRKNKRRKRNYGFLWDFATASSTNQPIILPSYSSEIYK
jgi:hypothetical protein